MKSKKTMHHFIFKISFALFCFLLLHNPTLNAQVGINTTKPNVLTELDIQNLTNGQDTIPKGIMIPRMSEEQRNQIDVSDSLTANSLMIYNTSEDCFNFYSRTRSEWVSICGTLGKATISFDVSDIEAIGTYIVGKALDPTSNYLRVKVTVTKPGTYDIGVISDNGYTFNATGQFLTAGSYTIVAQGIGQPINVGTNQLTLTNNNTTLPYTYSLTILPDAATYTINCDNIIVNGVYEVGKDLDLTNTITLTVTTTKAGSWSISSDVVEGVSFSGSGELSVGTNTITLNGTGKPTNINTKHLTLISNSVEAQEVFCKTNIYITIPRKRILSIGGGNWAINGSSGGIADMFKNTTNFGNLNNSKFKTYVPTFLPSATTQLTSGAITPALLKPYVEPTDGTAPVDIIAITYNGYLFNDSVATLMTDYLKRGGIVIMCCEANGTIGQQALMTKLFNGNASISNNDIVRAGSVLQLPIVKSDDMILNGPFGDIRGLYIGEDNGFADVFDTFSLADAEWVVTGTNYSAAAVTPSDKVFAMKAKNYNFLFIGDGGAFSYIANNSSSTTYPAALSPAPNFTPIAKANYGMTLSARFSVVNSILAANAFAWALRLAETNGINSGK